MVEGGDTDYLFVFSAAGVRAFYALVETEVSKGMADWRMLRRKLPDELFLGRRTLPHDFFGRAEVSDYLHVLEDVVTAMVDDLGPSGTFDVFGLTRTLGHRLGLGSWAGRETLDHDRFDELIRALDELDGSAAFVRPEELATVAATDKEAERAAMATVEKILGDTIRSRRRRRRHDLLQRIVDRWRDADEPEAVQGTARDVILLHLGSMSNLFAALGWTIADLIAHDDHRLRVLTADDPAHLERCALESTRLAQRSIMLREVMAPIELDDGDTTWRLGPGVTVATLLPLTNTSAAPGLDRYDPDRWRGRRLAEPPAARELVTVFGHGPHTCPAQPFSLSAMALVVGRLFGTYELEARYPSIEPRPGQIGGVARAASPCPVAYQRRSEATTNPAAW